MTKVILATNNQNKLREVRQILEPLGITVLSQKEAGVSVDPEENGTTFEANAEIKARAVYDIAHCPVIADDSGLCVDALDGAPGVYSARYAPEEILCETLLQNMQEVPEGERDAKFVCAIAFIDETGALTICRGECCGTIGFEKRGTGGFGYDPVFMYGEQSFAEVPAEMKNQVSHRANALKKLYEVMKERYCD